MTQISEIVVNNISIRNLMKSFYTLDDLDQLKEFFQAHDTLKLVSRDNGLYPAIATEETKSISGYTNTWVRDTIMITNYQVEMENFDLAVKTITALRDYFYKYQFRFKNIIEGKVDKEDPMQRPHIRFNGYSLEEISQKWAHAQNDALGYFLWISFKLANNNKYIFTHKDYVVYSLFPLYFEAIEYWKDMDSGHWEETRKIESSSIGVVIAALVEMKKFLKGHSSKLFMALDRDITIDYLDDLINRGKEQLRLLLPYESPPQRKADGALIFLIYPLEVVTDLQANEILNLVLHDLKGDYGIKRYIGDSYWCADYKKFLNEEERTVDFSDTMEQRDKMLQPGKEAQWCIFDPIVSTIYGKKYLKSSKSEDFIQQTYFFNRSLGQITSNDFYLGGGKCPEAYYIEDSKKNIYIPNDHVPLAWTQANFGIAYNYMKRSLNKL